MSGHNLIIGCRPGVCAAVVAAGLATLAANPAFGDLGATELQKLTASDAAEDSHFGDSVAIEGDVAAVGAYSADNHGVRAGAVYIFGSDGGQWREEMILHASDGDGGDRFGFSVAMDDGVLVVGAYDDDDNGDGAGSAYIYYFDRGPEAGGTPRWTEVTKLMPADGNSNDYFGTSVAIDGEIVAVSAPSDDDYGPNSGSVYVFRRAGEDWVEEAELRPEVGGDWSYFGRPVAVIGDVILAGYAGQERICVFKYEGSEWFEQASIVSSDGEEGDNFGSPFHLRQDMLIVGAAGDQDQGEYSGSAYVFRRIGDDWIEQDKLLPYDGEEEQRFGYAVSVYGNTAVVGVPRDDGYAISTGSVYVFKDDGEGWSERAKLTMSDEVYGNNLGAAVAIWNDTAMAGSERENDDTGSVCVFSADQMYNDCNANDAPDYVEIALGMVEDADENGIPDECFPPGSEGLVPQLQNRTLYVWATDYADCDEEESDQATYFEPYDRALEVICGEGVGRAAQTSTISLDLVTAAGSAEASGLEDGGSQFSGRGESTFEVLLAVPESQWISLWGHASAVYDKDHDAGGTSHVVLTGPDHNVLVDEVLSWEDHRSTFGYRLWLEERRQYTLSATAECDANHGTAVQEVSATINACLADVNGDGAVDMDDAFEVLGAWGPCDDACPADVDCNGRVNLTDLAMVFWNWGPCQ